MILVNTEFLHQLIIYQKSYFEIIYDFFLRYSGKEPEHFNDFDSVVYHLKEMYEKNKNNMFYVSYLNKVRLDFFENLTKLYTHESAQAFKSAQSLDVFKINLGGSSRFLKTQLNAVRKSLLLTDMVLIPDPILPWLEKERVEEKFSNIRMIEAVFFILNLRDLLNNNFDIPPFFIFPSWEKILEEQNSYTQENISNLFVDFFNLHIDKSFESKEDLINYAFKNNDEFLKKVESKRLFIAPNGLDATTLRNSIDEYKIYSRKNRTEDWCKQYLQNDIGIVLNGIHERLVPQFHLLENSNEMGSNPYLCIPEQAYYYRLISQMSWLDRKQNIFDSQTQTMLSTLCSEHLNYLANFNDDEIKMLRKADEHILFKNEMRTFISSISNVRIEDIDYVSREFSQFFDVKIKQHIKELDALKNKYRSKNIQTLMLAGGTLAVNFMPLLGPLISVIGAGSVGLKYFGDKVDEKHDFQKARSSYVGVIALAKQRGQ